jgi:hypothetical protein
VRSRRYAPSGVRRSVEMTVSAFTATKKTLRAEGRKSGTRCV